MAKFIETANGIHLNLDHVRCFQPIRDTKNKFKINGYVAVTVARDSDGSEFEYQCYRAIEDALYPVIPAYAGFVLLGIWFNEDLVPENLSEWVHRIPIIGWRMTTLGPDPVTIWDDFKGTDLQAIQCPDGRVEILEDMSFKNFDAFLDEVRIRWQDHIEAAAKKKLTVVKPE